MSHAQQVRKVAQAAKTAAISLPALVAAHPAFALVSCQWSGFFMRKGGLWCQQCRFAVDSRSWPRSQVGCNEGIAERKP